MLIDGWTEAALLAICGDGVLEGQAERALRSLLDHNLIYRLPERGEEPQFGMLETIRAYALHQLQQAGTEPALRKRHAAYYTDFVEPTERQLFSHQQRCLRAQLEDAYPNLRAALTWSLAHQPERALQLAGALWHFWVLRESPAEGQAWIEAALAGQADAEMQASALYCRALHGLGRCLAGQTRLIDAIPILEQALALAQQGDDRWRIASVQNDLGFIWSRWGDYAQAEAYYTASLRLREELGDPNDLGATLLNCGTLALRRGSIPDGRRCYEQALALFQASTNADGMAIALNNLGAAASDAGDFAAAEHFLTEALTVYREVGIRSMILMVLANLADVAVSQGELARAQDWMREAVDLCDADEADGLVQLMEVAARLLHAGSALEEASALLSGAHHLRQSFSLHVDPSAQRWHTVIAEQALAALGAPCYAAAIQRGQALSAAEIVAALQAIAHR